MIDDISDDVSAAIDALSKTEAPGSTGAAAPVPEEASSKAPSASGTESARDDKGRFAPKAKEDAPEAPKSEEKQPETTGTKQPPSPETGVGAPQAASQKVPAAPAPSNWKGAAKVDWNRLPANVQQALAEELNGAAKASSEVQSLRSAIGEDRATRLVAEYGSVENGLKSILAGADMANKDPLGFIQWLAKRAGINLASLSGQAENQGQQQPQGIAQPNLQASQYEQRIAQLEARIQEAIQQQQQASQAPILAEIERFRNDPANPYYNDVEQDIGRLLQSGMVKGNSPSERLKNAYDMAMWARPDLRQTLLTQERERLAREDAAKVEAARKAAGSIAGSPSGGKPPPDTAQNESLEDTVRRIVNGHL